MEQIKGRLTHKIKTDMYEEILKQKIEYYGNTGMAHQAAAEEFSRITWEKACEAQKVICNEEAGVFCHTGLSGIYWYVDASSILNAPNAEYGMH